jgi:DNA polymerase III subunit delta'
MSARKTEQEAAVRHPRETADLFGHREAETALLNAYRSGRIPHAWLIGGPQGIGKATLAYRMARFVLANSRPMAPSVQQPETLALDPGDPVARQVTAGSHGGLLVLERGLNDRGVMRTVITVDETRETISFFGSTAAVDGWRVCIVDTVDELNPNAANALLKILEEPPQRSLFLLVSHSPARALPTILSRCRKLPLRSLATDDVIRAASKAADIAPDDPALMEAADASEGSVSRALTLLGGDALKLQQRTAALLATLPQVDPRELHALGEALGTSDRVALAAFIDGIDRWIGEKLRTGDVNANLPRLARLAEVWEKIVRAARDTESYNLERKPLVFSVFGMLAEATR